MAKTIAIRAKAIRWHQLLALLGGIGLLLWGGSGLLHPIMTAFGPQQAVFYPPHRPLDLAGIHPIHDTLAAAGITQAAAVRVVASDGANLLQVTETQDAPRRYFRLDDGTELVGHDHVHAVYLARHYLKQDGPVRSVDWVDAFTPDYPWVNRLLPVYRVTFDRPDDLSIYIYTETNAAAGVDNRFKSVVQTGFRWFHTWSWFPAEADWARVVLIALLVGSLLALAATGIAMIVTIRRRGRAPGLRGWHRMAGYVVALPLLMFTSSGLFHLIQYAAQTPGRSLTLSPPLSLENVAFPLHEQWADIAQGLDVSSVSIVQDNKGRHLYRLGLAADRRGGGPQTARQIRNARFDGLETVGLAVYLDARTGQAYPGGDRALAVQLGERFTGVSDRAIRAVSLVTRFGPGYDFRNKRLPVWRLDYGPPVDATLFVDTTTGVLADKVPDSHKLERASFSFLHKWNFLFPLGRDAQNIIVSLAVVISLVFMAAVGLTMDAKRRARRSRPGKRRAAPAE